MTTVWTLLSGKRLKTTWASPSMMQEQSIWSVSGASTLDCFKRTSQAQCLIVIVGCSYLSGFRLMRSS